MHQTLFDPYSVRDAEISAPAVRSSWNIGETNAWTVCVRANAKNRMGAYIGIQDTVLMFRGGKVTGSMPGPAPYYCDNPFGPFPELEAVKG